jgi:hypothetical protein
MAMAAVSYSTFTLFKTVLVGGGCTCSGSVGHCPATPLEGAGCPATLLMFAVALPSLSEVPSLAAALTRVQLLISLITPGFWPLAGA